MTSGESAYDLLLACVFRVAHQQTNGGPDLDAELTLKRVTSMTSGEGVKAMEEAMTTLILQAEVAVKWGCGEGRKKMFDVEGLSRATVKARQALAATDAARQSAGDEHIAGTAGTIWKPTQWVHPAQADDVHCHDPITIVRMVSPFYECVRYAVRRLGYCMNIEGGWEHEPMPSSRDDAFYERCRFKSFTEAAEAAQRDARGRGG